MKPFLILMVATALTACAASPPSIDVEAEAAELMRISREWSEVAGSGDLEATLAYWADDAVMMPPGMPPLKGKQATTAADVERRAFHRSERNRQSAIACAPKDARVAGSYAPIRKIPPPCEYDDRRMEHARGSRPELPIGTARCQQPCLGTLTKRRLLNFS